MNLDRFTNSNGENLIKNLAETDMDTVLIKVEPYSDKAYMSKQYLVDDGAYLNHPGNSTCNAVSENEFRANGETLNLLESVVAVYGERARKDRVQSGKRVIRVVTGVDLAGGSVERKRFMANRKNALREEMGGDNRNWADFAFACATSSDTVPAPMVDAFDRLGFATEAMTLDEWVALAKTNAPATKKKAGRSVDLSRVEVVNIADGSRDSLENIADGSMLVCAPYGLTSVLSEDEEQRGLWSDFFGSRFPDADVYFIDAIWLSSKERLIAGEYKDLVNRGVRFAVSEWVSEPRNYTVGHSVATKELFAHSVYLTGEDYAQHFPYSKLSTYALVKLLRMGAMTDRLIAVLTDKAGIELKGGLNVDFAGMESYRRTYSLSEGVTIAYPELNAFRAAVEGLTTLENVYARPIDVIEKIEEMKESGHENYSLIDRAWISTAEIFMDAFVTMFNDEMSKSEQGGEVDKMTK